MNKYKYGRTNETIIRCSDGKEIPVAAPNNQDWVELKEWLDGGGKPDPYDGPQIFGRVPVAPPKDDNG